MRCGTRYPGARYLSCAAVLFFVLGFLFAEPCLAQDAGAKERASMGVFLSNFSEVHMLNFDAADVLNPEKPYAMIRFGIWHNYINNYKKRIRNCTDAGCKWGSLTIDGRYVKESIERYFGYKLKECPSVEGSLAPTPADSYHFDGKVYHFEGAAGEAVYHAKVDRAWQREDGLFEMQGRMCLAEDMEDCPARFTALARPHVWKGRKTWAAVSLHTQFTE